MWPLPRFSISMTSFPHIFTRSCFISQPMFKLTTTSYIDYELIAIPIKLIEARESSSVMRMITMDVVGKCQLFSWTYFFNNVFISMFRLLGKYVIVKLLNMGLFRQFNSVHRYFNVSVETILCFPQLTESDVRSK